MISLSSLSLATLLLLLVVSTHSLATRFTFPTVPPEVFMGQRIAGMNDVACFHGNRMDKAAETC